MTAEFEEIVEVGGEIGVVLHDEDSPGGLF